MALNTFRSNSSMKETYKISDFIKQKSIDDLTYRNLSILLKSHGLEVLDHNLFSDYINDIEPYVVNMEFEDAVQQNKYKYSPDLLAYDVYGSVQLDFIILLLNDMIDYKEFDLSVVRMLRASDLFNIFNIIYNKNQNYISKTREDNKLFML